MANYDVKGYIKDSNNYYFKDATARSSITTINNNIGDLSATGVTGASVAAQITALNGKIPTVNNGTLTIQRNGTNVATFTANQSGNATANITVPTALSALTTDATHRLVTDTQISAWNNKADKVSSLYTYLCFYQSGINSAIIFFRVPVDATNIYTIYKSWYDNKNTSMCKIMHYS